MTYLLLGIAFAAIITFIWNYKTTIPWLEDKASAVLSPVIGGIVIGFIMNMPTSFLERRLRSARFDFISHHSRVIALFTALILLIMLAAFVIILVIPELWKAIMLLISSLREFADSSHFWKEMDISGIPILNQLVDNADSGFLTLADAIERRINEFTPSIISFTLSTIVSLIAKTVVFFVSFIFAIYFILNKEMLKRHLLKVLSLFLPNERTAKLSHVASISATAFSRFITAQVTEALIIGILCFIGMLIFRFPYAPTIGVLTGVMALIPMYGAVIGALIGAFMIAVISPWKGLFFLIFIIVLQQLEGDLIYPRVVGSTTGVPSVYVFIAVTLGGSLLGIWGMLFAVPVFSIIYTLLKELYHKKEKSEKNSSNES